MNFLGRLFGSSQASKQKDEDVFAIPGSSPPRQDSEEDTAQNFTETPKVHKKKGKWKTKAQRELSNLSFEHKSEFDQSGENLQTDSGLADEEGEEDAQMESDKPKTKRERKPTKIVDQPETTHDESVQKAAFVTVKKPRKPRKKKTAVEESPQDLEQPPETSKSRRKKSKVVLSEPTVNEDDDEEIAASLSDEEVAHAEQQIHAEASNISHEPAIDDEQNGTSARPSAKALGKRKAIDTLPKVSSEPKRSRKSKESPGTNLLDHGFSRERSGSHGIVEDLVHTAQELYIKSTMQGAEQESVPPPEKRGKRKLKAKTPIMLSGGGLITPKTASAPQRATTQVTPINKQSTNTSARNVEEDDSRKLDKEVENLEDPFQTALPSSPKSSQKRKRRLPVESQEGELSNSLSQGASKKPAAKKIAPGKSAKPKEKGPVRKGRITTEEAEAIDTAVETYRELHELTQFKMNEIIQNAHGFVESKDFWTSVREAAPEVPHRKIYENCRRKYHNFEARASWTKEQDDELRDAYEKFPQKWKQIGELINRLPSDARDRWRNYLVCGDKQRKDYWDKEEEDRLRKVVAECVATISESRRQLNDSMMDQQSDEKLIDWGIVSEKMGFVRSRLQCVGKWKQLKEREESDEDERLEVITKTEWRAEEAARAVQEMTGSDILQLLHTIRDSGAGQESKIPWLVITEAMNKLGKRMSLKVCFRNLRSKIPNGDEMRFRDALEHLISAFEKSQPHIPARYKDKNVIRDVKRRPNRHSIVNPLTHRGGNSDVEGPRKVRRRYNGNEQGDGDTASVSKAKRKQTGKFPDDEPAEEAEEVVDNGEGPSKKKKRTIKRILEASVEGELAQSKQEPYSTPAKERMFGKENQEQDAATEEGDEIPQTSKQRRKKKKLRESMKTQDESQSQSQEPIAGNDPGPVVDEIAQTLQSLKKKRKVRKDKARELDDILREEMAIRGRPGSQHGEITTQQGQQASKFSDQEQNPEPNGDLNANVEDQEAVEFSDDQDSEINGDMHLPEARLTDEDEDEEQEQDAQARGGYGEIDIDPDEGEVYGISNGLSPHPSFDDEAETTPQQAESASARSVDDDSISTSNSSSADLDSDSNETPRQAPGRDFLDQELEQFGEEQEIEADQEREEELEQNSHQGSDEELEQSGEEQELQEDQAREEESEQISHQDSDEELAQSGEEQEMEEDQEREEGLERNSRQDSDEESEQNPYLDGDNVSPEPLRARPVSPDLDTPVKYDGRNGGHTSLSPDLCTPIEDDRKDPRSFRVRAKLINYDDTAHLAASDEEETDSSGEELRPKINGTQAEKSDSTKLKVNGVERRSSFSSSDDSIPAEATPQHIRAERDPPTLPPLPPFREQAEDIDWAAVRRRRALKGKGYTNSGGN